MYLIVLIINLLQIPIHCCKAEHPVDTTMHSATILFFLVFVKCTYHKQIFQIKVVGLYEAFIVLFFSDEPSHDKVIKFAFMLV